MGPLPTTRPSSGPAVGRTWTRRPRHPHRRRMATNGLQYHAGDKEGHPRPAGSPCQSQALDDPTRSIFGLLRFVAGYEAARQWAS